MTRPTVHSSELENGCLYVVATPIGNLGDITYRAVDVLTKVDWIAAEDTRHSQKLLQALGIANKKLISLHEHNEEARAQQLLKALQTGEKGALISDAGTPLINDPGYQLVKVLRQSDISVVPIPGASAVITALSAAGVATDRFAYEGFLPARSTKRVASLEALLDETRTMVFYESPHRLMDSLQDFSEVFTGRKMVVAKELTKQFEQFVSGSVEEVIEYFQQNPDRVRGEFVVILSGKVLEKNDSTMNDHLIKTLLAQSLPVKQISEIVASYEGQKKKAVYQRVLELKEV
ncbi:16S rRNA (cytidine(1402)-2'-O)-methyltransferase [Thiomicrorhabdus indica]|uniref:16S rRNA (cytidine(1402)-2'-O)-methyltransferase n=1 Tax=Thiomicrorhabdus indica TaxID=2267253 RepID=UPI00102DA55F|nr:16S rRNA (cytidine(1402)-2'-O)-methyltransferase [Thiomicrorhabdus indica]